MQSDDLTPAQRQTVQHKVRPMLAYLNRLKKHMEMRRFPSDGRLYLRVLKAHDAHQSLTCTSTISVAKAASSENCRREKRKISGMPPSTSCVP
jgi:2-methylaconitate cis-trans-isomerase PrpF